MGEGKKERGAARGETRASVHISCTHHCELPQLCGCHRDHPTLLKLVLLLLGVSRAHQRASLGMGPRC